MASTPLQHLAIIMDGNGNWARKKGHQRVFGHVQGLKNTLTILKHCSDIKVPYLTLFALSSENLHRPLNELESLKKLLKKALNQYADLLFERQMLFDFIGDISIFSKEIQNRLYEIQEKTKAHSGLNLILALNYGGRQEIQQAFHKALSYCLKEKKKSLEEKDWIPFFPSSKYPSPDLIVRTGGQMRLSNFYLWSSAYSELFFTKKLWPEFTTQDLDVILEDFYKRKRNFGRIKA